MKTKRHLCLVVLLVSLCVSTLLSLGVFATGAGSYRLDTAVDTAKSGVVQVRIGGVEAMESSGLRIKTGTAVTLKANALDGFAFDHWQINVTLDDLTEASLTKDEISFAMPSENLSVTAVFRVHRTKFTLTMVENEFGSGNFGHKDFKPGDTVKIDATPYDGFRFVKWIDEDNALFDVALPEGWEKQRELTFTMPARDVTLSIEFEYITYYFDVVIKGEGEIEVSGKEKNSAGKYEFTVGEELFLSAMPAKDFVFISWSASGEASLTDFDKADTGLLCPAADFTVTANFASSVRNLTMAATDGGTVTPEVGVTTVGVDTVISVSATPATGYAFSHWECSSEKGVFENVKDSETTFTVPDEDCTVTAVFIRGGYQLKVKAQAGGNAKGAEGVYEMGEKVTIEASPLEGYAFSHWQSSVSGAIEEPYQPLTRVLIPGEHITVTAVFVLEANLDPDHVPEEESSFSKILPYVVFGLIFLVSAVTITLVILRERFHLSYSYLLRKWLEGLFHQKK